MKKTVSCFLFLFCWIDFCAAQQVDDVDRDGYTIAQGDCDDNNPSIHPGAIEICDGIDNDCNGIKDDNTNSFPVADAGGPYIITTGNDLYLTGLMNDLDMGCREEPLSAKWFLNNDLRADFNAVNGTISWANLNGLFLVRNQPFDIKLVVTDPTGRSAESITQLTIYERYPMACFTMDPSSVAGCGQPLSFDASCSIHPDPRHTIMLYEWDFGTGGGFEAQGVKVMHSYPMAGTYSPSLRITDDAGNSTLLNKAITIKFTNIPVFTQIGPLCQGSVPPSFPLASTNSPAIEGNWSPAIINTTDVGTKTYSFTPDLGQCATVTTMDITVGICIHPTLTIAAVNREKTYGSVYNFDMTIQSSDFTVTGLKPGDAVSSITLASTGAGATADIGPYPITASSAVGTGIDKYNIIYNGATMEVVPKVLNITADNQMKIYGSTVVFAGTEFSTVTGELVNGNSVTTVSLTSEGSAAAAESGTYPIVASAAIGSGLGNYSIEYHNGNLTVISGSNPTLTVSANNKNKHYGDNNPLLTYTITGFVNGESLATSGVLGNAGVTTTALRGSDVGSYPIIVTQGTLSSAKYNFDFVNGTLTIGGASLTIKAKNAAKIYGTAKSFTGSEFSAIGLVNGNTINSVSLTSPGSAAIAYAGTYPIVPGSAEGTGLSNYIIRYINGTMTVNPASLTIIPDEGQAKVYGSLDPIFNYSYTSLVGAGDVTGLMGRVPKENVGTYAFTLGSLTAGANYNLSIAAKPTFKITPLNVTVTANPQTKKKGTHDPNLTYSSIPSVGSNLDNGQVISFLGSLTRKKGESIGTYPIMIGSLRNTNYTITYVRSNLTITCQYYNISGSDVSSEKEVLQNEIGLKVYPNPFTDHVYFDLQLKNDSKVLLELFNVDGVKLSTIYDDAVIGFDHCQFEYFPKDFSSGMLIYRLVIEGQLKFTGKLIHK